MAELVWSLNGKYFKDFGVGISSSDGILGELKPKKQDTKDWSEYNGVAVDLTKKPKYEAREFTLSGWIVGADWLTMLNNFNALFGEFRNAGKQRLLLDVFGQKTFVFDVRCEDEIELKKTFKQGKMVGMFSLKLIEHNPIKKILYNANSNLQLSFNTPKWVEVNIDGKIDVYKGTVNINKTLTDRFVTGYNFGGRNLLLNSSFRSDINKWKSNVVTVVYYRDGGVGLVVPAGYSNGLFQDGGSFPLEKGYTGDLMISFEIKVQSNGWGKKIVTGIEGKGTLEISLIDDSTKFIKYSNKINVNNYQGESFIFYTKGDVEMNIILKNIKLEKGNKATDWTPAPEEQHFISIAGNIDEITGLTTNATVLWERL